MFLDESGDHSLTMIDPQYPLFVLGGIIVDRDYASRELAERVRQFKLDVFDRDDFILHTADIVRSKGIFSLMRHPPFRERFYTELNALMRSLDYQVIACVIKKDEHLTRYGFEAIDPYLLSLNILVERFCFEIGATPQGGLIVAERRDPTLDHQLELAWLNLRIQGTRFMQASMIEERISGLTTRSKEENIAGLQLADLVVSPIGRFVLGKRMYEDWEIIESKFRRRHGTYHGAGLVVLPRDKE
jgi:hypothetical protein